MIPTTNSPTIAAVGVRQIPKSYFVEDQSEPARTLRTVFTVRPPSLESGTLCRHPPHTYSEYTAANIEAPDPSLNVIA